LNDKIFYWKFPKIEKKSAFFSKVKNLSAWKEKQSHPHSSQMGFIYSIFTPGEIHHRDFFVPMGNVPTVP